MADFIPTAQADKLTFATNFSTLLTATPADYSSTAPLAADIAGKLATAQAAYNAVQANMATGKSLTAALSTAMQPLVDAIRVAANVARADVTVTDETLATIGIARRSSTPSPKPAPAAAPEFSLDSLAVGQANFAFREAGSANPRARAMNAIGVIISIVDGTAAPVAGEQENGVKGFYPTTVATVPNLTGIVKTRAYACWITQKGLTSPWSAAVSYNAQS